MKKEVDVKKLLKNQNEDINEIELAEKEVIQSINEIKYNYGQFGNIIKAMNTI